MTMKSFVYSSALRHLFIGSALRIDFSWVQRPRKSSISRNEHILCPNNHYWGSNKCIKEALYFCSIPEKSLLMNECVI